MRLYLDSQSIIYVVEGNPQFADSVDARLQLPGTIPVASDLSRLECRMLPIRNGDAKLLKDYDDFFEDGIGEVIRLTRRVIDMATELRARYKFSTPDSIHLAAALVSGCQSFFTGDKQLRRCDEIAVECLDDMSRTDREPMPRAATAARKGAVPPA